MMTHEDTLALPKSYTIDQLRAALAALGVDLDMGIQRVTIHPCAIFVELEGPVMGETIEHALILDGMPVL